MVVLGMGTIRLRKGGLRGKLPSYPRIFVIAQVGLDGRELRLPSAHCIRINQCSRHFDRSCILAKVGF